MNVVKILEHLNSLPRNLQLMYFTHGALRANVAIVDTAPMEARRHLGAKQIYSIQDIERIPKSFSVMYTPSAVIAILTHVTGMQQTKDDLTLQ